jgi:hypothetical protein
MEHGHPNHLADDWSTTAYWYQTLPGPRLDLLPVERRLPRRAEGPSKKDLPSVDSGRLDAVRQRMYAQRDARMAEFTAQRDKWFTRRPPNPGQTGQDAGEPLRRDGLEPGNGALERVMILPSSSSTVNGRRVQTREVWPSGWASARDRNATWSRTTCSCQSRPGYTSK